MKKLAVLILCGIFSVCFLTACGVKKEAKTINYQRRLKQYLPSDTPKAKTTSSTTVDLSEGPKLRYDANFGPRDVNFDFKIKNPY